MVDMGDDAKIAEAVRIRTHKGGRKPKLTNLDPNQWGGRGGFLYYYLLLLTYSGVQYCLPDRGKA
jgi:hypothetical protein